MKVKINNPIFKIIANGGLSSPDRGEGRFYPSLLIDASAHPAIQELFDLHKETPPGDAILTWAKPDTLFSKSKILYLCIEFEKPMPLSFAIEFDVDKEFPLVDGIIQSRGVCISSGKPGEKVAERIDDAIIIEVPNVDFDNHWNNLLLGTLKSNYKKKGVPRKEVNKYVKEHVKTMREIWNIRRENENS